MCSSSAWPTVAVIILFGFGLATALDEGDVCRISRSETDGICRPLKNCPKVAEEIGRHQMPTFCSRIGGKPIVCCPPTPKKKPRLRLRGIKHFVNRRISEKKCIEYQAAVYNVSESRDANGEIIRTSEAVCNMDATTYVVNGEVAKRFEFPHMALIGAVLDDVYIHWMCGGSLISEQYILTAAHCLTAKLKPRKVGLGAHSMSSINEAGDQAQIYDVAESIPHPDYRSQLGIYNDIGLIRLEHDIRFNYYIRPACLPPFADDLTQLVQTAVAAGWGRTEYKGQRSDQLMKVELELFSAAECNQSYTKPFYPRTPFGANATTQLCAGSRTTHKDTCQGDSGGPLQVKHPDAAMYCMYSLLGVTSAGRGCGGINSPGLYSQIRAFVPWIEMIVWPTT